MTLINVQMPCKLVYVMRSEKIQIYLCELSRSSSPNGNVAFRGFMDIPTLNNVHAQKCYWFDKSSVIW